MCRVLVDLYSGRIDVWHLGDQIKEEFGDSVYRMLSMRHQPSDGLTFVRTVLHITPGTNSDRWFGPRAPMDNRMGYFS
jgi:hypothetical protein